jgi:ParB-like chromosome segregation protein Spo0J
MTKSRFKESVAVEVEKLTLGDRHRDVDGAKVTELAASIKEIGQISPIIVDGNYIVIAGVHRLEAVRKLGRKTIDAVMLWETSYDEDEAELIEIAENLYRAELTPLQRDEQLARYVTIVDERRVRRVAAAQEQKATDDQSAQSAPIESRRADGRGHRPESGINSASRQLGIDRTDAQRAVKVASLSEDAKKVARDTGLDNIRSALLEAAKQTEPEQQVAKLQEIAERKAAPAAEPTEEQQLAELVAAWDEAGDAARQWFRDEVSPSKPAPGFSLVERLARAVAFLNDLEKPADFAAAIPAGPPDYDLTNNMRLAAEWLLDAANAWETRGRS